MHQHKIKEWLYSTSDLFFQDTGHRIMVAEIMTVGLHVSLQLGHRAPEVGLVDYTCRMVINYKGFITTAAPLSDIFFDPNDITHCSSNFFAAAKNDCAWQSRSLKSTTTATMVGLPKTIWEDQRAWRPKNLAAQKAEGTKVLRRQKTGGAKNI